MSRQYFNSSLIPTRYRDEDQWQVPDPRENVSRQSSTPRNVSYRSTFQPTREPNVVHYPESLPRRRDDSARHSLNRVSNAPVPRRRYRLESPPPPPPPRPMSGPTDERSKRHRSVVANPIPPPRTLPEYPRPDRRQQYTYERPPPVSVPIPASTIRRRSLTPPPAFLLNNLLQQLIGAHEDVDDYSSSMPIDLFTLGWMMPRMGLYPMSDTIGIQLINLFDLFAGEETPSVGLTDEEIEGIPRLIYRKSSRRRSSNEEKCSVCLSEYNNGEEVKRLRCRHIFHGDCIDPWLKTSIQCPVCRAEQKD